jgi:uncharacterized protein YkwD
MVNKIAVTLVGGLVLVAVLVVGGVAALVLGGGSAGEATPTFVEETPLSSPTPTAAPAATATGAPTATATSTPTATVIPTPAATATVTTRSPVPPVEFDERAVERLVGQLVNERRRAADLDPLELEGGLAGDVSEMARDHSRVMAAEGAATHVIDGNTSADRYREYELYENCKWVKAGEEGFARPDQNGLETGSENGFEAVSRTVAGREYDDDVTGETRFNADERDVAEAVVNQWWNTTIPPCSQRLTLPNARYLGVGVEVTKNGEVYATANLC